MATETTTTLSADQHSYYHKRLLVSAEKMLKIKQLGFEGIHPKGLGTDSFMLKWSNIAESTDELTEGVPPSETTINANKYTIPLKQYGQFVKVSDWALKTAFHDTMKAVSDRLGYTAALSIDSIVRNVLVDNATVNTQYAGSGNTTDNNIAAGDVIVTKDALKGIRYLKPVDAPAFDDGFYRWVVHTSNSLDIQNDTAAGGFIELNKYVAGLAEKPLNGEVGKAYGARVIETNNINKVANATPVNVYRTLMLAKDAFAFTKMNKNSVSMYIEKPGSAGTADPLHQLATVGYKAEFGCLYVGGTFTGEEGASPELCIQIRGAATGG